MIGNAKRQFQAQYLSLQQPAKRVKWLSRNKDSWEPKNLEIMMLNLISLQFRGEMNR